MSGDESREAAKLMLEALHGIREELRDLRDTMTGLQIVLVEHFDDEQKRFERLEALLSQHSSRIRTLEALQRDGAS